MFSGVIIDVESKRMSDGTGIIFSLSWLPVSFKVTKGWKSKGRGINPVYENMIEVRRGTLHTVMIRDVLADPCIGEDPDIIKKVGRTTVDTLAVQGNVTFRLFDEAIQDLLVFTAGSTWLGHSIDRDIQFMVQTDQRLGSRIFKKNPMAYPTTCCRYTQWSTIAKVCTQQLLTHRCPRFFQKYVQAGGTSARLCELLAYVNGSVQTHTSAQDVLDLFAVLHHAFEEDRFQLEPHESYMIHSPLKTFSVSSRLMH
jgi:DNA polymerase III epsilon subunit-like protein